MGESNNRAILYEELFQLFTDRIPFHRLLRLSFQLDDKKRLTIKFPMREDYIGNVIHNSLHGGVISSVLDTMGGLTAYASFLEESDAGKLDMDRFARLGTIDLRIDYLLPGVGKEFTATGFIMRQGRRVVVTRMELRNEEDSLIAVGTGAYNVS